LASELNPAFFIFPHDLVATWLAPLLFPKTTYRPYIITCPPVPGILLGLLYPRILGRNLSRNVGNQLPTTLSNIPGERRPRTWPLSQTFTSTAVHHLIRTVVTRSSKPSTAN
jgi:hypothetical protein